MLVLILSFINLSPDLKSTPGGFAQNFLGRANKLLNYPFSNLEIGPE